MGMLGVVAGLLRHQLGPPAYEPLAIGKLGSDDECIIECPGPAAAERSAKMLCLTTLPEGEELCYYPEEVILVTKQNNRYILYDYQGRGHYIHENLREVERNVPDPYPHFFRVNKQNLFNMTYARRLDKCRAVLALEDDFECDVPRNKLKTVETRFYATCRVAGR